MSMTKINMDDFINQVITELGPEYQTLGNVFRNMIWDILQDPNANTDRCIVDENDIWYICLQTWEDPILTAENLLLAVQDGESIDHFAGRVVTGK